MKTLISDYEFNSSAKNVIFFSQYDLSQILLITNVTHNIIIYNFADPTSGGSMWVNTLTLTYDTSAMSSTDVLQIWVDIDTPADTLSETITKQNAALNENFISTDSVPDTSGRSLYDLLDSTNKEFVPLGVAPMGIDVPGQAPASQSIPVALANEQIYDANISAVTPPGATTVGKNALLNSGAWLDVSQYRSISMQMNALSGVTASLFFEASNDGINTVGAPLYDNTTISNSPVSILTFGSGSRFFSGPLQFKYFRARVSSIIGGPLSIYARLSMAPYSPITSQSGATVNTNISSISGNGARSASLAGTLVVGGSAIPGTAHGTDPVNPLAIAGTDTQQVGSGQPTVSGKVRRALTDSLGNFTVTGPDIKNPSGFSTSPIDVRLSNGENSLPSVTDLLAQILAELRVATFFLKELPDALNAGRPILDDPTALADEIFNEINTRR